jgi:hypothetical protein
MPRSLTTLTSDISSTAKGRVCFFFMFYSVQLIVTALSFTSGVLFCLFLARQPLVGQGLLIHELKDHTQRRTTVGGTPLDE